MVFEQQHVFGFHVAVDDALTVCVVEGPRELLHHPARVAQGQRALADQSGAERFTRDERHHEVEQPAGFTRIEEGQDVRVVEACEDLDFAIEAVDADRGRHFRAHHLDRDVARVPDVTRAIDDRHGALAEVADVAIPAGQCLVETLNDVGHGEAKEMGHGADVRRSSS
jgi:hypothetical protein